MLSDLLSSDFSADVRERGEKHFRSRAVHISSYQRDGDEDFVDATVQGSDRYDVRMVISGDRSHLYAEAGCDCPSPDVSCEHIWATIRALEAKFSLPAARAATIEPLDLVDEWNDEPQIVPAGAALRICSPAISGPAGAGGRGGSSNQQKSVPLWQELLSECGRCRPVYEPSPPRAVDPTPIVPWYIFEEALSQVNGSFSLTLAQPRSRADGTPGKLTKIALGPHDIPRLASDVDRHICLMLMGTAVPHNSYDYSRYGRAAGHSQWQLRGETLLAVLGLIGQTGRLYRRIRRDDEPVPVRWDPDPYEFVLTLEPDPGKRGVALKGFLRRSSSMSAAGSETDKSSISNSPVKPAIEDRIPIQEVTATLGSDLFLTNDRMGIVNTHQCGEWLGTLRRWPRMSIPDKDRESFLKHLAQTDRCPPIEFPADWNVKISDDVAPQPELLLRTGNAKAPITAMLRFKYGQATIESTAPGAFIFKTTTHQVRRRRDIEAECLQRLQTLGFRPDCYGRLTLHAKKLPGALAKLMAEKWSVLLDNKSFRTSSGVSVQVGTGIDWFELEGKVEFNGQSIGLPEILAAARRGEQFVRLGDGSFGMLPEEWLARHHAMLELASVEGGQIRYAKAQIGLIDALLAELPEARFDEQIAQARRKLQNFGGISAVSAPEGFAGELRPYQKHGLAWMDFLREFEWGGCLADDMGLGKTVQMLARLLHHKRGGGGASLAVVPKSVVFNWAREAARFAPDLRVLDYTGTERHAQKDELAQADLVLTTYGTLKRDIQTLREKEFEYVILDEAQAIKNPTSQNAKAVRLLKAKHRLALTGTPVENCIGDLWSIFEFLNPGMMGTVTGYKRAFKSGGNGEQFTLLQRMLRPFILRRTKQQVAPELPARSEQLIECELTGKQAATYGELRDHYRAALLGRLDREGMAKSKVYVLEALLRLRQAACHPGLIDESRRGEEAAKLETLLPMLQEMISEGHKALVFSQFTSMLSIVRERLDQDGIVYEYLDGQTTNRQSCVDRFQSDPACRVFLISLKAGGVGLNLTAAEYVFILDPWWNPAVEAQAIDRTHRIGQDKNVIAYRLIARNTVEAKILELQQHKRGLAEAIITQANSVLQDLTREDLEMLLS